MVLVVVERVTVAVSVLVRVEVVAAEEMETKWQKMHHTFLILYSLPPLREVHEKVLDPFTTEL